MLPFVSVAASEGSALPQYRFVTGKQLIYRVNYSGVAQTDFQVLFDGGNQSADKSQPSPLGLAQSLEITLQGQLVVTILDHKNDDIVLAYNLRNAIVKLITNGQDDGPDADKIRNDLSRDVFAVLNRQGKVLSVRFDSATSKLSQSFARSLIGLTQFVFPNDRLDKLNQWKTQEEDPNGRYVAQYRRVNPGAGNSIGTGRITFQKTITRYLPASAKPSPTEFNVETTITPTGSLMATFDQKNGWVSALVGAESQTIEVAGKTVAHTKSTLGLNYFSEAVLRADKLAALRATNSQLEKSVASTSLSAPVSKDETEANIERTELASDDLETLLSDLAKLEAESSDRNETPLYLKFKALIYLHPESSATLGQMLATADAKSLTMRVLTGALGSVANPHAQTALVSAIKARPTDWPALSMLIPALDQAGEPTLLAEKTIHDLATQSSNPDIASTAELTLGAMARNLANTSPERATRIVDSIIKQIDLSSSVDTTRQLLLALGNAGSAQAYPTIARFTTDSSPLLRAASASALRWVDSDQSSALLIKLLSSDPEPSVRLEAARALGFRQINANSFEAQKQSFAIEKDEKVRLALLRNLWKARAVFPEARQLIEKAATSDVSEDVRKASTELLATDQAHSN